MLDWDSCEHLDLVIDGADEFDQDLHLIKGGGGALLREKIVAESSGGMIVVADASKRVDVLGAFPLPIEVNPYGWEQTKRRIEAMCAGPVELRGPGYLTDNGNPILEIEKVQESATPVTGSKSNNGFRQWQNIVSSFAEYNSSTWLDDEDNWNPVGVVGFSNMLGSAGTQEQHARDAGNFARFANLVRINPSGSGSNVEPFGKRGQANFNPVVPRR